MTKPRRRPCRRGFTGCSLTIPCRSRYNAPCQRQNLHLDDHYCKSLRSRASFIWRLQCFDRVPVQMQFLRDRLDRGAGTAPADVMGEPLRVQRIVGQKVQALALHGAAIPAVDSPHFDLEVDARVGAGQIAHPARAAVVPAQLRCTADTAECFFERRISVMTRAMGSPKTPRTLASGRKPGNRYASRRRLDLDDVGIGISCQISTPAYMHLAPIFIGVGRTTGDVFTHTTSR